MKIQHTYFKNLDADFLRQKAAMLPNHWLCAILLLTSFHVTNHYLQPATIAVWRSNAGTCASKSNLELLRSEVEEVIDSTIVPQLLSLGLCSHSPANSCADIYQGHPSGYYWLNVSNEPQQIYCSLNENRCCNDSDGKWMRIAFLNMSDPSVQCPDGWREVPSPIRTYLH